MTRKKTCRKIRNTIQVAEGCHNRYVRHAPSVLSHFKESMLPAVQYWYYNWTDAGTVWTENDKEAEHTHLEQLIAGVEISCLLEGGCYSGGQHLMSGRWVSWRRVVGHKHILRREKKHKSTHTRCTLEKEEKRNWQVSNFYNSLSLHKSKRGVCVGGLP